MIVKTFCVICGKRHGYKLGKTRRLRQVCSERCQTVVYGIRLKAIGDYSYKVRLRAKARLEEWRERQKKLLNA